ncbi:MAG: internalin, putative [Candidatus Woesebacteria bacterium]|nr:MAG: internalin, putative [Candidatus Woesebacteria bacterium]
MNKSKRRLIALISVFSILVNSISFWSPLLVLAQETPEPTPVVEMTPEPTVEPTAEPTVEPTSDAQTNYNTPIPEATLTPTLEPTFKPSPSATVKDQPQENVLGKSSTPQLESSPKVEEESNAKLNAFILGNTNAEEIEEPDLSYIETTSATLKTDKFDYAPTDAVVITGSGFLPNTEYELVITSETGNFRFSDRVTTDESGSLFYTYQLDGTYRPNYLVEVKDTSGTVVASVSFTDTLSSSLVATAIANYDQWTANVGDKVTAVSTNDGDTTYITNSGNGQRQSFTFSNAGVPAGATINSVTLNVVAKEGQGGAKLKLLVEKGPSDGDRSVGSDNNLTGSYATYSRVMPTNPFTGAAWTLAEVNSWSVKFGVENSANKTAIVTQIYLIVDYTEASPTPIPTSTPTPTPTPTFSCVNDTAGVNDEPGQKDLTKLCRNLTQNNPLEITWNWDETSMPGSNTADACALFDTDNDGLANYAICVTWNNGQSQVPGSPTLYSCNDTRSDRCAGSTLIGSPSRSSCTVTNSADDPFPAGASSPNDTKASCSIDLADIGNGSSASLLDVCSYPSTQPNSDPSDCVIIRTDKGSLTIIKDVVPNDSSTNWNFAVSGPTNLNLSVSGSGSTGINSVDLGTYTITETAGNNTNLNNYTTQWSCTKNGSSYLSGTGTSASGIQIGKSGNTEDSVVCTFTNTLNQGTITIVKDAQPNDPQDFSFTGDLGNFSLDDDDDQTLPNSKNFNVVAGTYTVTENSTTGWDLTNITCNDPTEDSSSNLPTSPSATIKLAAGENVTCTFTNTKRGSVAGIKYNDINGNGVKNDGENGLSGWTVKLMDEAGTTELASTTTDVNGNYSFMNIVPGNYKVCEINQTDWSNTDPGVGLTSPVCNSITVVAGEQTISNFGNFQNVSIKACKLEDADADTQTTNDQTPISGWSVSLIKNGDTNNKDTKTTGEDGCYTWSNLGPGSYAVSEEVQTGWTNLTPTTYDFGTVLSGSKNSFTFINSHYGEIIVKKIMVGGTDSFDFTGDVSGTINSNNGTLFKAEVLPGHQYTSTESAKTGWDLTSLTCDDENSIGNTSTRTATFNVEPGETVTCTFTNTKRGSISGYKYEDINGNGSRDENENNLLPGWTIVLKQGDTEIDSTTTGGDGAYSFANVIPGDYQVCEVLSEGWIATDPTEGNCKNVTVDPGKDVQANFGNLKVVLGLSLTKSNSAVSPLSSGSEVIYTLVIKNTGNQRLTGVTIKDAPAGGFSYVNGSGLLEGNPITPTALSGYLEWYIDTLEASGKKGDTKTLTYKMKSDPSLTSGVYPNIAIATGVYIPYEHEGNEEVVGIFEPVEVLAVSENTESGERVESNAGMPVNSQVELKQVLAYSTGVGVVGQVLGASTEAGQVLPAAGSDTRFFVFAIAALIFGLFLKFGSFALNKNWIDYRRFKKGLKNIFASILFLLVFSLFAPFAKAFSDYVSITKLSSYINKEDFKISYAALSENPISAQFYVKKDGDSSWRTLGSALTGASGYVQVSGGDFYNGDGKYFFKVVINGGTAEDETSTIVDRQAPDAVRDYRKEKLGDGHYKLYWRNPDNEDFDKVIIYRSDSTNFTADSSTEVATIWGSKDTEMTSENAAAPGKEYYFAIRAIDKAGNASSVVSDPETQVSAGSVLGASVSATSTPEVVKILPKEKATGEVLGEEKTEEATPSPTQAPEEEKGGVLGQAVKFAKDRTKLTVGIIAVLLFAGYLGLRKFRSGGKK